MKEKQARLNEHIRLYLLLAQMIYLSKQGLLRDLGERM